MTAFSLLKFSLNNFSFFLLSLLILTLLFFLDEKLINSLLIFSLLTLLLLVQWLKLNLILLKVPISKSVLTVNNCLIAFLISFFLIFLLLSLYLSNDFCLELGSEPVYSNSSFILSILFSSILGKIILLWLIDFLNIFIWFCLVFSSKIDEIIFSLDLLLLLFLLLKILCFGNLIFILKELPNLLSLLKRDFVDFNFLVLKKP